ncbi:MAG TPA: V-type ATPase 116kDa subunit family protein [Actinomycetes bacterium]
MRLPETVQPVAMRRVALVAPAGSMPEALAVVADTGLVEIDPQEVTGRRNGVVTPDQLAELAAEAVAGHGAEALAGWAPEEALPSLTGRLTPLGAAVVPLARPVGSEPPTLLRRRGVGRSFSPLVETYATIPYDDIDPTLFAGLAYVAMFGMMFGDVGHGLLLLAAGLFIRTRRHGRLARLRRAWTFVVGAGIASTIAGLAYGEFFGPTGVLPVRWIDPLEEPLKLMLVAVAVGAVLLAVAYAIGTANRVREGGWSYALYAPSGLAGATLFLGGGLTLGGAYAHSSWLVLTGVLITLAGTGLSFVGLAASAGKGGARFVEAGVELFDLMLRLAANVASFARLAAFGLTHAALGAVVWDATTALWSAGGAALAAAVLVFLAGNALAFGLEALVAGIQALRLEYYELFSRVFQGEGRPFRPLRVAAPAPATKEGLS